MAESTKCAHPPCSCRVAKDSPYGKYCSPLCKEAGAEETEVFCECHHPGCRGMHP
jgi:hypothetical protein